jgi:hypothetical protein
MCTGRSVAMKKPVLAIYRPQEGKILSAMIRGGYQTRAYVCKSGASIFKT